MAINYYWFNSVRTNNVDDRTYNAASFAEYLNGIISSGVLATPSNNLQVLANSGMTLTVKAGSGWINGYKMVLDADMTVTISTAHATFGRYDRVVFALDHTNRLMNIYVKTGTAGTNPSAPALSNTSTLKELSLAQIYVPAGATSISQSRITDTRPLSTCGYVTGLINQVDTSTLYSQFQAAMNETQTAFSTAMDSYKTQAQEDFDEWFESLQEELVSNTIFIEKKAVVTTATANQATVAIPSSLEYGAALDVLHVYVNGFRLVEGVNYTKTSSTITFTPAISAVGTKIEITNWKTLGSDNVQTVVSVVTDLSSKMTNIQKYRYDCTGTNDNTAIMNIIGNFISGASPYAGVGNYSQLELSVYGKIDLSSASTAITTTNTDGYFAIENSSTKRVILDLSNAEINVSLSSNAGINAIFDIAMENFTIKNPNINAALSGNNIDIIKTKGNVEGGRINVTNAGANSITGIECTSTNTHQTIKNTDIKIYSSNTSSNGNNIYGYKSRAAETDNLFEVRFINCSINNTVANNTYYGLFGFSGYGTYDDCSAYLYNYATGTYGVTNGFDGGGIYSNCQSICTGSYNVRAFTGTGKYVNCKAHAASQGDNIASGFRVTGECTNCEGIGRNVSAGSGYGFFLADNNSRLKLVNCEAYGYTGTGGQSVDSANGAGISTQSGATGQVLICIGCECVSKSRQYMVQKDSIIVTGTSSGASATLIGNVIYKAIQKHSGSNVTVSGNIVI